MPDTDEFSVDRYIYRSGQRLRIGFVRTIRPADGETNSDFESRMDGMAADLEQKTGVESVEMTFERGRAGAIVQCVVTVAHTPRVEAVTHGDRRLAGGRPPSTGRGQRGA